MTYPAHVNALVALVSFGVSGIYLSFLLTVIGAIIARARGWQPEGSFRLGKWAWPVLIIAAGYLGAMFLNVVYPSGLSSARAFFDIDWITLFIIFIIAVVGAIYLLIWRPDRNIERHLHDTLEPTGAELRARRRPPPDLRGAPSPAPRTFVRVAVPSIVAHLDLDAFYAAVEELESPELRTQPLVVGGDPRGRGVVATANYVARRFGIHSAMSCAVALRRCPQAVFVRPRHALYREYSPNVFKWSRGGADGRADGAGRGLPRRWGGGA